MADRLDLVFKKIVSRQYSSAVKEWYEENPGIPFKLKGSDVWVDSIPETPPANDTAVVKKYDTLTLIKDTSVPAEKAWVAEDPVGTRVGNFIGPRYGQDYTVRVFDGADKEIPTTDGCGWFWDYESGVLTFDNDPGSRGWNDSAFKVKVYQYIGAHCDDIWESMQGSVWQEPTISISNDAPTEPAPAKGDRYLISRNPTPEGAFDGHAEEIAQFDGVVWQFTAPKSGMITYVVDADKLYLYDNDVTGWGYSGIDAVDLDYDVSNSDLDSITVKEAIDEIDRLIRTSGHSLYVDIARVDTYVETGSPVKPYKTLEAANAVAVSGDTLKLQSGTYDSTSLVIPDGVSVVSDSVHSVDIIGDITFGTTSGASAVVENVNFSDPDSIVTFVSNISGSKIHVKGQAVINNDFNVTDLTVKSETIAGPAVTVTGGNVFVNSFEIDMSVADLPALRQTGGKLNVNHCDISGTSSNAIVISSAGQFIASHASFENKGTGIAANIANNAQATAPNSLIDVRHIGGIRTGAAITVVEGVVGGNPESTVENDLNLIYRGSTQLKNDSQIIKDVAGGSLIGLTVNDAINRVASVVRYDETIGEMFIETCVDNTP